MLGIGSFMIRLLNQLRVEILEPGNAEESKYHATETPASEYRNGY